MSRLFSCKHSALTPYVPGEQPRAVQRLIKLNTNESPFPPSPGAVRRAAKAAESLMLYSDIGCTDLTREAAKRLGVKPENLLFTNGSDEILNFAFMAFADEDHPAVFPDITYGFYKVFAALNHVPYTEIPLSADFTVNVADYIGIGKTIFLANPNAPTGIALPLADIERIVASNPDNLVVIDEAYVDFGGESAVPLIEKYDNLLVTQTFSKSRSLAGGRLGFGIACPALIRDLNTIKFSTNPYNVNSMTMAAGLGALEDDDYFRQNVATICSNRAFTAAALEKRGFRVLPSATNFLFVTHPQMDGKALNAALKADGILVRHFDTPRLTAFNRITIGSRAQMEAVLAAIDTIITGGTL